MAKFEVKGLDKLDKQLKQMQKGAKELEKTKEIPFSDLFTSSFMKKYTKVSSIDELLKSGGFSAKTNAEFNAIPEVALNKLVAATTKFTTWEEMLTKATELYVSKKLGL